MRFTVEQAVPPLRQPWPSADGPWMLSADFALIDGRPECVRVEVTPMGAELTPITTSLLRRLRLNEITSQHVAAHAADAADQLASLQAARDAGGSIPDVAIEAAEIDAETLSGARRRAGRPQEYDDRHYREVAAVYAAAVKARQAPTRAVAKRWTVSTSAAAKHVSKARDLGYLPPTTKGRVRAAKDEQ